MRSAGRAVVSTVALLSAVPLIVPSMSVSIMSRESQIAFVDSRGDLSGIYVMNADGSGQRRLTWSRAGEYNPVWSPDGNRIAFARGVPGDIYVMNSDGSGRRDLTRGGLDDGWPVWSPDGRRVAFTRYNGDSNDVWVMSADGSAQHEVTHDPVYTPGVVASWSSDGRKIAFASDRDGHGGIYVVNADGNGGLHELTHDGGSPVWSPNGKRIAFVGDGGVVFINADGGGRRSLTRGDQDAALSELTWSPDGKQLAFKKNIHNFARQIAVVSADGTGERDLTSATAKTDSYDPGWSPDGQKLVFVNAGDIVVINSDGSGSHKLIHGRDTDSPTWSRF
jgi:Tol biopolymer transport system component